MVIDECGEGDWIIVPDADNGTLLVAVCSDGIGGRIGVTKCGMQYWFYDHDPIQIEMVLPAPPAPGIRDVRCSSSRDGP